MLEFIYFILENFVITSISEFFFISLSISQPFSLKAKTLTKVILVKYLVFNISPPLIPRIMLF